MPCSARSRSPTAFTYVHFFFIQFTPRTSLGGRLWYLHFMLEETEAREGKMACGGSHQGAWHGGWGFEPRLLSSRGPCVSIRRQLQRTLQMLASRPTQGDRLHSCSVAPSTAGRPAGGRGSACWPTGVRWAGEEVLYAPHPTPTPHPRLAAASQGRAQSGLVTVAIPEPGELLSEGRPWLQGGGELLPGVPRVQTGRGGRKAVMAQHHQPRAGEEAAATLE